MRNYTKQIWAYICFAMILTGMTGLSWYAFREHGWVESLLGVAWDVEMRHPILASPIIAGTILLVVLFMRGGLEPGKINRLDSIMLYVIMLCGAYFIFRFFYSGAWPF
jgi:hypothetical protein